MTKSSIPTNLVLPPNVTLGKGTQIKGSNGFNRFQSEVPGALQIGQECLIDHVHFAMGPRAKITIGQRCYFTSPILLCELEMTFGDRVMIGWNTTIPDSDVHPIHPGLRMADAVACSPLSDGKPRPELTPAPVVIEDDVWIGPCVTILKGVTIGAGSFIEAGSMVSKDIPPMSRVEGNPARVIGKVEA